jgi:hypothetical protein
MLSCLKSVATAPTISWWVAKCDANSVRGPPLAADRAVTRREAGSIPKCCPSSARRSSGAARRTSWIEGPNRSPSGIPLATPYSPISRSASSQGSVLRRSRTAVINVTRAATSMSQLSHTRASEGGTERVGHVAIVPETSKFPPGTSIRSHYQDARNRRPLWFPHSAAAMCQTHKLRTPARAVHAPSETSGRRQPSASTNNRRSTTQWAPRVRADPAEPRGTPTTICGHSPGGTRPR